MRGVRFDLPLKERALTRWDGMARAAVEFADAVERPVDKNIDPEVAYYMACERLRFAIRWYVTHPRSKRDRAALIAKLSR